CTSQSTPNSKNNPSKQKKDATKRRENKQQINDSEQGQEKREESCNKFVMVDDNHGLCILPLQAQYMTPPSSEPPYKRQQICKLNKVPTIDEYAMDNSEDKIDGDNHSMEEYDEYIESSEALIKSFSPHIDLTQEEEILQVIESQCLSPRGFHHEKFHFKKQDVNTITADRPNTRLFSSRSSQ
ncbi:hypothetical protein EJD97_024492, partial [Solanum chilense]